LFKRSKDSNNCKVPFCCGICPPKWFHHKFKFLISPTSGLFPLELAHLIFFDFYRHIVQKSAMEDPDTDPPDPLLPFLVLPAVESKSPRSAPSTTSPLHQPPDTPSPLTDLRIDGLQSGPHSSSTGLEANNATQRLPASPPQGDPQELNHLPASK
jgi:hypothetical protein